MNKDIEIVLKTFEKNGFEVAIVGGAARDLLMGKKPSDWDLTTNAKPDEMLRMFPGAFYNNRFGTVGLKSKIGIVEATTYRREQKYSDSRQIHSLALGERQLHGIRVFWLHPDDADVWAHLLDHRRDARY